MSSLFLLASLAVASELAAPDLTPRFEESALPSTEVAFPSGYRVLVQDSGESAVTVATWVSGGTPEAARLAAELWFARELGTGTIRDAYQQVGARAEAVVYADGTLFMAVGPPSALPALLRLEQARFATSEGAVEPASFEQGRMMGSRWVRGEPHPGWAQPMLAALYPSPHPYHPHEPVTGGVREARAYARELYHPANTATLVIGDLDEAERKAIVGALAAERGEVPGPSTVPAPAPLPAAVPTALWVEAPSASTETVLAVGWTLPGMAALEADEAELLRGVVESAVRARTPRLDARCTVHLGLPASTLVCASPLSDAAKAARWSRRMRTATRDEDLDAHVVAARADATRTRIAQLSRASWEDDGRAYLDGPAFGLTGATTHWESPDRAAIDALIAAHLDPDRAVSLLLTP